MLELSDDSRRETRLDGKRRMREPLDLGAPLSSDDEDRKLVELQRHRCLPPQIIQKIEHLLSEHGTAEHRVVWAAETYPRDLHDLLRQRQLLVTQLIHRELRETLLFAHGVRLRQRGIPAGRAGLVSNPGRLCSADLERNPPFCPARRRITFRQSAYELRG